MPAKERKTKETTVIFDSVRKPTAPPSRMFRDEKAKEKSFPSGRKVKHKRKVEINE